MEKPPATPSPRKPNYVGVFGVLAVLTLLEVGVTYLPLPRVPVLVPLALPRKVLKSVSSKLIRPS